MTDVKDGSDDDDEMNKFQSAAQDLTDIINTPITPESDR